MGGPSRLRRTLSRWADSDAQLSRDMRKEHHVDDAVVCIADAADRARVTLRGTLRSVTLRPRGGVPALEAELYDGTGSITLVWLGRRTIEGVVPGSSMVVSGRVGVHAGSRVIYNPHYQLVA